MSMPSSACQRLFDIPELTDILASQLQQADLSALTRINRQTRKSCLPLLFKVVDLRHAKGSKVFLFVAGAMSLGRNTRHIKDLSLGPDELAFYYNCVYDFDVFNAQFGNAPAPRPVWFPPPDTRTRQFLALPPMTCLSRLTLGYDSSDNPYRMPSSVDTRAALAQLCWLLSFNPHLSSLVVESIVVKDSRDRRILVGAIAGLRRIKKLLLRIECRHQEMYQLGLDLFFCVQPSVQHIVLSSSMLLSDGDQDTITVGDGDDLIAVVPRRQEPAASSCEYVIKERLGIQKLDFYWADGGSHLPIKILEALPAQQVTEFSISGLYSDLAHPLAAPAILRHSTTLRSLDLEWSEGFSRLVPVAPIFENCVSLESLTVASSVYGLYIELDEVQEAPWVCSKLRRLSLGICGCELPREPGYPPYYARPTPITLTEAEARQFEQLERLYSQIGRLRDMKSLCLFMFPPEDADLADMMEVEKPALPGLMNLGDVYKGWPGYLNRLAGLTKLESLAGSICGATEETKATLGWREAVWIGGNGGDSLRVEILKVVDAIVTVRQSILPKFQVPDMSSDPVREPTFLESQNLSTL
ncbi:hypothetical protein BGX24_008760 [Mortierella sp. AD032]|nr:hypothetical protein BGX24_008760 [Mortierella sp. AD032]